MLGRAFAFFVANAAVSLCLADEKLAFEKVVLRRRVHSVDLLFVVLTEPKASRDKLDELVVKYAAAALREAAEHQFDGTTKEGEEPKHKGNVVFLVRNARDDRRGGRHRIWRGATSGDRCWKLRSGTEARSRPCVELRPYP